MKQFVFGPASAFQNLCQKINNSNCSLSFPVHIPSGQNAKLVFRPARNNTIEVMISKTNQNEILNDNVQSNLLKELINGDVKTFNNAEAMKNAFSSMSTDFQTTTTQENSNLEQQIEIDNMRLAGLIKEEIVGQDEIIDHVAQCVTNHYKKPNPKRPLVVMFSGSTGTGKTETVNVLTRVLKDEFNIDVQFVFIKCNEFSEDYRVSSLVGSPAGYVGHDEKSLLDPIREHSRCVFLFDEIEKAAPNLFIEIMSMIDRGIITLAKPDENGNFEYDCKKCVFVMTSNINMKSNNAIGSLRFKVNNTTEPIIQHEQGSLAESDRCRRIMVNNGFKPELAGRIQYFFEYNDLTNEDVKKIMLLTFKKKAKEYGIIVSELAEELIHSMEEKYHSSAFGVRSLESDLDNSIGKSIITNIDTNVDYLADGTLDNIRFIRR